MPVQLQPLLGLHSTIKLVALPANVILGWRWLAVTNTLTYNAAKRFYGNGPHVERLKETVKNGKIWNAKNKIKNIWFHDKNI